MDTLTSVHGQGDLAWKRNTVREILRAGVTEGVEMSQWQLLLDFVQSRYDSNESSIRGGGINTFLSQVHIPWVSLFCILTKTLRSLACSAEAWAGQQLCSG